MDLYINNSDYANHVYSLCVICIYIYIYMIATLTCKRLNSRPSGRYNELYFMGFIYQLISGGHKAVGMKCDNDIMTHHGSS